MKRYNILIFLLVVVLFALLIVYNSDVFQAKNSSEWKPIAKRYNTDDASVAFDEIKSELKLIPQIYTEDDAAEGSFFIISNDKVMSDITIIDKFIADSESQTPSCITIVNYNENYGETENPIIIRVLHNGFRYYAIEDDTRIANSENDYNEFAFDYLKAFEENNDKIYVLLNDKNMNYSQYMKSLTSSNSKDFIEAYVFCYYKN